MTIKYNYTFDKRVYYSVLLRDGGVTQCQSFDYESWGLNLFSIPDGYYSEFIVFDNLSPLEKTLCGTIDRMWVETDYSTGIRYTDTSDYKTNSDPPKNSKYNISNNMNSCCSVFRWIPT